MSDSRTEPETIVAPAACPFCGSRDIKTTSKTVETSSYWRCVDCGEVWNADRLRAASRYHRGR